jgi:GTPase SAR1 family protein
MSEGEYSTADAQCSEGGVNNENWQTERTRSGVSRALQIFLGNFWGVLALNSLVLPAVSIVFYDYLQLVVSVRIGVPLAIILCFVILLFTYTLRFSARGYELLHQIREGCQPTLARMALLAFTTALIMALVVIFVLEEGLTRALRTIFFSLTFASVTLSAMLMSIRSFDRKEWECWLAARARQVIERRFNPYISGGPVREPDMFFGREELLKRIINTLHNNSIMIHGPRRIGKTSLLYQLANRLRAASDPDYAFIPALIDLEGTAQEEFFHTLMEEILEDCQPYLTERLSLAYNEKGGRAYTHRDFARDLRMLIDHLQQNSDKEVRLILLLDEVDVMNRYDQLVQQQLRRIFMKTFARNLGAVVAGVHISKEWDRLESPWYNLFLEMELPPLSHEEAVRLIEEPVKGVYSYEDEAVEAIWQYSQGHPQLVQQLCLEVVNRLLQEKRSRVTRADVESVYQEIEAWERAQEEREERERARPLVKRVAEEGPTYEAEEGTDV